MPRYDFECHNPDCRKVEERVLPLSQFDEPQVCRCGHLMTKVHLRAPAGFVSQVYNQPYKCPVTGKVISGKKAHEENLAQHGCRVLETGEKEANDKRRAADDAALDAAIEGTVEREIALMPTEKKERLANELASGTDASIERHTVK
jgi:hypothetical protein